MVRAGGAHEHMQAWGPEEDEMILFLVGSQGPKWKRIVEHLPGRSVASVRNRYQRIQKGAQLRREGKELKNMCHACGQPRRGHICYAKRHGGLQVDTYRSAVPAPPAPSPLSVMPTPTPPAEPSPAAPLAAPPPAHSWQRTPSEAAVAAYEAALGCLVDGLGDERRALSTTPPPSGAGGGVVAAARVECALPSEAAASSRIPSMPASPTASADATPPQPPHGSLLLVHGGAPSPIAGSVGIAPTA